MPSKSSKKIYLTYILLSVLFVVTIATIQFNINIDEYGEIVPRLYVAPLVVGSLLGYLLATQRILRNRIEEEQSRFVSIVDMAEEFTYLQSIDGSYSYISPSCFDFTGYSEKDFYQNPDLFETLIFSDDRAVWQEYKDAIKAGEERDPIEIRIVSRQHKTLWIRHAKRAIFEEGELVAVSSTNIDINDEVLQKQVLQRLSEHDPLTGLPNRRMLNEHVAELIKEDKVFHLIMMDLDRFKFVNDSLGHSYGDRLLKQLSQRLQVILPEDALLARFGGDEFVFVLHNDIEIEPLIQKVLSTVEQAIDLDDYHLSISASFGWVSYPHDATDMDTLISFADATMYSAKQKPGTSMLAYAEMADQDHERMLKLECKLQEAVAHGKIVPYYQPIVDARSGNVIGAETLARWNDDELGFVSPEEFIAIAESNNLINALGLQILEKSIICAKRLSQRFDHAVYLSVNVSPQQLIEAGFAEKVVALLEKHDVPASALKIEVTESLFIGGDMQTIQALKSIRAQGIQVALDDFGTGYSALGVLRDQCIDILKIDRSFVQDMTTNEMDQGLVGKIIEMAHMMKLKVIAEGVETIEHAALLHGLNSDMLQGYFWSKPIPEKEFFEWLDNKASHVIPKEKPVDKTPHKSIEL